MSTSQPHQPAGTNSTPNNDRQISPQPIKIGNDLAGYHHGQYDWMVWAIDEASNLIGYLQYVKYNQEPALMQYIFVEPEHRRRGVASRLIERLSELEGGYDQLQWSMQSDEGFALRQTLDRRHQEGQKIAPSSLSELS